MELNVIWEIPQFAILISVKKKLEIHQTQWLCISFELVFWTGDLPLLTFPVLTVTHKSPRGKGKQIFGQKEIKNYFPRKRKALQEAGKGGSAERFCEEEKGKCLKFSWNRDSQFIWRARDRVPSRPANDVGEEEEEDNDEEAVDHLATWWTGS